MKIRKKGKKYEINYRCPGYSEPISERFDSPEAAKLRIAEIEYEKSIGELRPPAVSPIKSAGPKRKFLTVSEFLEEYVQVYGLNQWGASTLSFSLHRINHYINPYIGNVYIQDLTTHGLDVFLDSLQDQPAVTRTGHKKKRNISASVIERVHSLLRSALNQAVAWGYISVNPALNCSLPKVSSKPRAVWSAEEAEKALELCDDPVLKTCMLLAIGGSLRIGEILGLTWDCVDLDPERMESQTARIHINKELLRCKKDSLEKLSRRNQCEIYFTFPELKKACTTSLVLKKPKTDSSIRTVYLPQTVADHLLAVKRHQEELKDTLGEAYQDFNLVIAQNNGRPYEERLIAKRLKDFIQRHNLTSVVFHSLRHCSTSVKLRLSGGDIKAVQGDTGHAQARMVTDVYAHTYDSERCTLAQKMEAEFFQKSNNKNAAADETVAAAHQLLQNKPQLAQLLLALTQTNA